MSDVSFVGARPVLGSRDLQRSRWFWTEILGLRVAVARSGYLVLRAGDAEIALDRQESPAPGHVLLHVRGVQKVFDRCVEARAPILEELHFHESGRRDFVVRDPDGHRVQIGERPRHGGRAVAPLLAAPMPRTAAEFWQAVVGFDAEPRVAEVGHTEVVTLTSDGSPVATVQGVAGTELPHGWIVHFTVDSMEEALAVAEARGGKVLIRDARTSWVAGPTGAVAALTLE